MIHHSIISRKILNNSGIISIRLLYESHKEGYYIDG
jgi:hypothetical protein